MPSYLPTSKKLRRGADKFIARPGRKQATSTKLGIYSTHFPWSSIHFLSRCSSLCKPLKKIQKSVRPTTSPRQQWHPRRKKNGNLSIVFSVKGTGCSPTVADPENRVSDQDIGSPGRPGSSGLQVPGELGHCRATTRSFGDLPAAFFLHRPSFAPAEMSNTPRW